MSIFTKLNRGDLRSSNYLYTNSVEVKLDSKGRISIPSFLRKNLGLQKGVNVRLVFDLKQSFLVLEVDGYER